MASEERMLKKKKHILNSLKRLLDKYSYSYISMQQVADEAGISKGGVRYHFPTKQALFMGLMEDFFQEIKSSHLERINILDDSGDKAVLTTLMNIENFVLNKENLKVFINLILYSLEIPSMMEPMKKFFREHLEMYKVIIEQAKTNLPEIDREEFDLEFLARITQIILISAGLIESIDPINMEPQQLTRYVLSLFSEQ